MNPYNGFPGAQRVRALKWLNGEYAAGRRHRPTVCDGCSQTAGILQAHSEDYSEPFGDNIGEHGLCYVCHMMIHCRFRAPGAWERYRTLIRSGFMAVGQRTTNWGLITRFLAGGAFPLTVTTGGCRLLDRIGEPPPDPNARVEGFPE